MSIDDQSMEVLKRVESRKVLADYVAMLLQAHRAQEFEEVPAWDYLDKVAIYVGAENWPTDFDDKHLGETVTWRIIGRILRGAFGIISGPGKQDNG